jgi:hypothetical protein
MVSLVEIKVCLEVIQARYLFGLHADGFVEVQYCLNNLNSSVSLNKI